MDQRHVHLNNPAAVEEEKELDDGEDENEGDEGDSFKSDSDFREETDPEEEDPGSQSRRKRYEA
jgi:hypothetical protein